jgi:serine protease AprX
MGRIWGRRRIAVAGAAAAAVSLFGMGGAQAALALTTTSPTALYVVSTLNATGSSLAASDVISVGGTVVDSLDVANGVSAYLTSTQVSTLQATIGVVVTNDFSVSVSATTTTSTRAPAAVFPASTGATQAWGAGLNGAGVGVAVIDTGIDSLPDFSGRLVGGVDLSGENNPLQDSYGHGTFVAGLIAGNGASSGGQYTGEAPGATLVSVKVAGASGSTDLVTVIKGIQWVVSHRTTYNIRVVNLSLGAQPQSSTVKNPLDRAVETAWNSGVVVVAAAGNAGPFNGTILSPGDDPQVITAGALDDNGTAATSDDTMTRFSSVGPTNPDGWLKPDLVTSGRSVISLRAPGSTVDNNNPSARIGTGNFVGSGTSFSSAITSGAAALVVQSAPAASPNTVKGRLLGSTTAGPVGNPFVDGLGALNAWHAVNATYSLNQTAPSTPTPMGGTVSLQTNWAGSAWDNSNWSGAGWNGSAWDGSAWDGSAWDGSVWDGSAWDGSAWDGSAWDSAYWTGSAWDGSAWDGSAWDGSAWDGSAWDGSAWDGSAWDGSAWD